MKKIVETNVNRKIIEKYFKDGLPIQALELIETVKAEGKLPKPRYIIVNPDLTPKNLPEKMGFAADPKIANLVVSFDKLGYQTISSCEGHPNRGSGFPSIGFWGMELFKVLSILDNWSETSDVRGAVLIRGDGPEEFYLTNFSLFFNEGNLKMNQTLAQKLSDFIDSKSL